MQSKSRPRFCCGHKLWLVSMASFLQHAFLLPHSQPHLSTLGSFAGRVTQTSVPRGSEPLFICLFLIAVVFVNLYCSGPGNTKVRPPPPPRHARESPGFQSLCGLHFVLENPFSFGDQRIQPVDKPLFALWFSGTRKAKCPGLQMS